MDVERTTGTNEKGKERRTKKFNGGKITDNIMRGVIMLIMAVVCVMISDQIIATPYFSAEIEVRFFHGSVFGITLLTVIAYIIGVVLGVAIGYLISPFVLHLIWKIIHRIESGMSDFESQDLIVGTLGLLFGLIIANLIGLAFARLPIIGAYGPIVFSIVFGYAGMSIAIRKRADMDISAFNYAIVEFMKRKDKNLNRLMEYAKTMRLEKKIRETMGVLF